MTNKNINYKTLQQVVDEETYRTDTSTLLAYDQANGKFLFRALTIYIKFDWKISGKIRICPRITAGIMQQRQSMPLFCCIKLWVMVHPKIISSY